MKEMTIKEQLELCGRTVIENPKIDLEQLFALAHELKNIRERYERDENAPGSAQELIYGR